MSYNNSRGGRGGRGGYRGRHSNSHGRGSGGRHNNHGGGQGQNHFPNVLGQPCIQLCRNFLQNGQCSNNNCNFGHCIQVITDIQNSDKNQNNQNQHQNQQQNNQISCTDVALWMENPNSLKIFTTSADGHWRLYNTANGKFQKEVEHSMGGPITSVMVESNYLFCGFEANTVKVPGCTVGMIFAWNLSNPGDEPMELHMGGDLAPYAHSSGIGTFITKDDMCFSGGKDAVIRIWKFDTTMNNGKGGFKMMKECCGHVGEITSLVMVNGMLWSASADSTIRLWDPNSNWECKYLITRNTLGSATAPATASPVPNGAAAGQGPNASTGVGHTKSITALVHFESAAGSFILSSSLDGSVKVWNSANGECLSSTEHGGAIESLALSKDVKGVPFLLVGFSTGKILLRSLVQSTSGNIPPMSYICAINVKHANTGHTAPINSIKVGPENTVYSNTFYTAATDGKLIVWQLSGDLGL